MQNTRSKLLRGKTVFWSLVVTNIVYLIMILYTIPQVSNFAGGLKLLDMSPTGYDLEYVQTLLSNLGLEGRSAYLYRQLPLDMLYPLLFGISYSLLLAWLFTKLRVLHSKWVNLAFLPFLAGLFDYMENIGIMLLIDQFPEVSNTMVWFTSASTVAKSTVTTLYFFTLIVTLIVLITRKLRPVHTVESR